MQQGQTYITIIGFPDPNYGVKAVNENKLPSLIMSSPLAPLYISQRPLSFTFASSQYHCQPKHHYSNHPTPLLTTFMQKKSANKVKNQSKVQKTFLECIISFYTSRKTFFEIYNFFYISKKVFTNIKIYLQIGIVGSKKYIFRKAFLKYTNFLHFWKGLSKIYF